MKRRDTVIDPEMEEAREAAEAARVAPRIELGDDDGDGAEDEEQEGYDDEPREPSKLRKYLGGLLSGNILSKDEVRRYYPYMLFVSFLVLLYISNVFRMQQFHRRHDMLQIEVKDLRAQSLTMASKRMLLTRQSQILKEVQSRGLDLKESLAPPKVIEK